jgi:hypothetical protein
MDDHRIVLEKRAAGTGFRDDIEVGLEQTP